MTPTLPEEITRAMDAWAMAEHLWRDSRDCSMERDRRLQADAARADLEAKIRKWGEQQWDAALQAMANAIKQGVEHAHVERMKQP